MVGYLPDNAGCLYRPATLFSHQHAASTASTISTVSTVQSVSHADLLLLLCRCPDRSEGLDHFLWLTGDRGACDWPGEDDPALSNVIKVVHFGFHHMGAKFGDPTGWEGQIKNKVRLDECQNKGAGVASQAYAELPYRSMPVSPTAAATAVVGCQSCLRHTLSHCCPAALGLLQPSERHPSSSFLAGPG